METAVVARRTGIYRCSGLGLTKYARAGEELPAHSTCEGGCEWGFKSEDNPRLEKVTIIIGEGPFFVLIRDEVPCVEDMLNLKGGLDGSYQVTDVDKVTQGVASGIWWPRILVKRVGDYKEGNFVYRVGSVSL